MNSETLCEICFQIVSFPTILSCCYSSVCLECLKKSSSNEIKNQDKQLYKCQFCKKENQSYSSSKFNTFLARYIEFCHQKGQFQNITCDHCRVKVKSTEAFGCNDCNNKQYCKGCDLKIHDSEKKNHKRSCITTIMKTYAGSINKAILCQIHPKEIVEHICLKDLTTLCKFCVPSHTRSCFENKIVSFE